MTPEDDYTSTDYYAHVQLPHGATVTQLTFYWQDIGDVAPASCFLMQMDLATGDASDIASAFSSMGAGYGSSVDDTIGATVDNSQYAYYLKWSLYDTNLSGYAVVIEYTFTESY